MRELLPRPAVFPGVNPGKEEAAMPKGDKRAWATVNKQDGGGKQSGSGRKG